MTTLNELIKWADLGDIDKDRELIVRRHGAQDDEGEVLHVESPMKCGKEEILLNCVTEDEYFIDEEDQDDPDIDEDEDETAATEVDAW